ncbi:uncharacterized protein [Montipora capricornis]|uniref:uncharacterized protein n=1 Tax=Montipora capricornis TaxID=246305 RepID=UPI0035F17C14
MDDGSERPIAFTSCTLRKAEGNYSQINKEALAIEYKNTIQHGNADGLSRLPLEEARDKETVDPVEIFQVSQMQVLPVSADMIRQATQRDPILSHVMEHTKQGWPAVYEKELDPFYRKKEELTIQDGCLMWGSRVLIPPKHQNKNWMNSMMATLEWPK